MPEDNVSVLLRSHLDTSFKNVLDLLSIHWKNIEYKGGLEIHWSVQVSGFNH